MAYHRSRSRGVGARTIRLRKSFTPICHCSRDQSISLTPIINPSQLLRPANPDSPQFTLSVCAFHLGFGLGYLPQGAEESEVLFTLIAERYERRSLGITSNLVFSEWERIFANPMATAAAIDRVVHHSVILEFDVPSYRTNAAQQRGQAKEVNRQN